MSIFLSVPAPQRTALSIHALSGRARLAAAHEIEPHPAALAAFMAFQRIAFAAPLSAALAPPVLVVRGERRTWAMVGHFAARLALRNADHIPVLVLPAMTDDAVARAAWGEIAALWAGHLAVRGGAEGLHRALGRMPELLRDELVGPVSARRLARTLGVDAGRFRGVRA